MIIILVILFLISLILLLWQISNLISVFFGSPYVKADRAIIIKSLKIAKLKHGEIFYELGCGNGDVLIEAARLGAKSVGFEISPYYYLWAKLRIFLFKTFNKQCHSNRSSVKSGIEIRHRNILNVDLSEADVVYCYLLPKFLDKLSTKFRRELKPGARLISIGFPLKYSTFPAGAGKVEKCKIQNHNIYIYKF